MTGIMTGSLQTKAGKYYIVLNTQVDGKRKQVWKSTGLIVKGNKLRATQMLRDLLHESEQAERAKQEDASNPGSVPFLDQLDLWLMKTKNRVDEVTYQGYESLVQAHIRPYFEPLALALKDVDLNVLQTYFTEKATHGRIDGQGGLSARSLRQHKNIIYQVLKMSASQCLIPNNPCEYVELPPTQRFEANFYTSSQINSFFALIREEPIYPLLVLTFMYGLRRSEVLGLKWDCVDFEAETITIRRTVVSVMKTVEKDKTKNETSRRSFPMPPEIKKLLLDLKTQQERDKKLCGKSYYKTDYVFRWQDGHPFRPDYVTRKFSKLLEHHDFPHIRFHDLRHSSASNLLSMGYGLKDVQEWLGHADIKMTANTYGHLDIQRKKTLATAMSATFAS